MKYNTFLIALALTGAFTLVNAQERLSSDQARKYAELTRQKMELLRRSPLDFEVDLTQPVGLAFEEFGGLIIPRVNLWEGSESDVGAEPVGIGELWLYNLTLEKNGWPVYQNQLDIVPLNTKNERVKVPRCMLGVCNPSQGMPVMLVYGKNPEPLLTVPLAKIQEEQSVPLDMTATESGVVTVSILGRYQAVFNVAELFL